MLSGGGSPLETKDLVRAGLFTLERAIILSVSGSGYQGHMADADALFTYQVVCPSHTATCAAFNRSRIPHEPHCAMHNVGHAQPAHAQPAPTTLECPALSSASSQGS